MEKLTKVCLVAGFLVTVCMVGNSFAYSAWRLDEKQNKMVWTDLDKTGSSVPMNTDFTDRLTRNDQRVQAITSAPGSEKFTLPSGMVAVDMNGNGKFGNDEIASPGLGRGAMRTIDPASSEIPVGGGNDYFGNQIMSSPSNNGNSSDQPSSMTPGYYDRTTNNRISVQGTPMQSSTGNSNNFRTSGSIPTGYFQKSSKSPTSGFSF